MKRFTILLLLLLPLKFVLGQNVQWASKVLDFSSELTPIQYSAEQALGEPNVLPAGGESPNAWTPDRANADEFLKVGFEYPIQIQQVLIGESYSPGTITNVYAYDQAGTEHLLHSFSARELPLKSRLINLVFDRTDYKVAAIKVELQGGAVPEYYSIDAIGISDSNIPHDIEVRLMDGLEINIESDRLSSNVNSEYKEFKPLLTPDGTMLIFSRKYHPGNIGGVDDPEDIWFSELGEDGEWKMAKNMGPELNSAEPNYVSAITPDGNTVVLLLGNKYLENGKMAAGVSISTKEGDEWTKPYNLEIINDYNYADKAHFFLSNNRQVLILSVERDDTNGGRDLYVSFFQADSLWSEPANIGNNVNTANDEGSPFLAADDKTLYFSSNGYSGYGGNDIYVSRRLDDSWVKWSDPENLGPEINTDQEDLFFNIPVTGNYAYYSKGVSADDADIYRVKLPIRKMPDRVIIVRGKLIDQSTGQPVEAKIIYERLSDGVVVGISKSHHETGQYEIVLPVGELYGYRAEAEGFIGVSANIDLRNSDSEAPDQEHDLTLLPVGLEDVADSPPVASQDLAIVAIEEGATVALNNIFFDFDKAVLRSESYPELDRVYKLLVDNPSMKIEIDGHTDTSGPEEYNMGLSKRRAQAVATYILGKGVGDIRLEVQFFGESKPNVSNETREGRIKNRRVEFKIIDK